MSTLARRPVRLLAGLGATALLAAACSNGGTSRPPSSPAGSSAAAGPSSVASSPTPNATNRASAPGVTATTITIGGDTPLTGVAAPGNDETARAADAYFSWVNAHGGVRGRKIVYTYLDDASSPSYALGAVHQLVRRGGVFAVFNGFGTATHLTVGPFLNSEKVPDLFVASGCACWNDPKQFPYTFGFQPDYTVEGEIQGQYVKQYDPGKPVGYLLEADDLGREGAKGLDLELPPDQVVSRQGYNPANVDLAPLIRALQAAGAQVVVSYSTPAVTALALIIAKRIGFHPAWVSRTSVTRRIRGRSCGRRSATPTCPRSHLTATSTTGWRRRTRSSRSWWPPGRTRRETTSSGPSRPHTSPDPD